MSRQFALSLKRHSGQKSSGARIAVRSRSALTAPNPKFYKKGGAYLKRWVTVSKLVNVEQRVYYRPV